VAVDCAAAVKATNEEKNTANNRLVNVRVIFLLSIVSFLPFK
jgi:hypothetical protein